MKSGEATVVDVPEGSRATKGKAPILMVPKQEKGGMKRGLAIIDLVLRIGAIVAALAAAATMGTSDQNLPFFTQFFQFEASYDDMPSFQYVILNLHLFLMKCPLVNHTLMLCCDTVESCHSI